MTISRSWASAVMTGVFFLCAVGSYHHRVYGEDGSRLRCRFPMFKWFADLVKKHALDHHHRGQCDSGTTFTLTGFVRCVPGVSSRDVFASNAVPEEMDVWQGYWDRLSLNICTVMVEEVFLFDTPQRVFTYADAGSGNSRAMQGKTYPLAAFSPSDLDFSDIRALRGQVRKRDQLIRDCLASEILDHWQAPADDALLALPVLEPVASLILKGCWRSICMLGFWPTPRELFEGFPSEQMISKSWAPKAPDHWSEGLSPEQLGVHLERLRSWAPVLLRDARNRDDDEGNHMQLELADTLQWLDRLRKQMITQSSSSNKPSRYQSHVLIASVFLACRLGSRKHMADVIPLALKVCLPGLDLQRLAQTAPFPRSTTVARASTYLDFAYILQCRDVWASKPYAFYAWADSSGQSSREWLMVMHACCSKDDLLSTYRAANKLTRCRPDLDQHHEAQDLELEEHALMNEVVFKNLTHHRCVPVGMASGKTRLEDKASAFLHTTSLECTGRAAIADHLASFSSWTTDLGTEVQLPQFKSLRVEAVLPDWFHKMPESDDLDLGEAADQAPDANARPSAIMPGCLIVPGCLHIVHNLTQDIHNRMQWWGEFWSFLSSIAKLLAERPLRERFINQCIRGTACADQEEAFENAGVHHLYEKRWQVVTSCLSRLLPIFPALRQAWSLEKFVADSNVESTVPQEVQEALASDLFSEYANMVHTLHDVLTRFEGWLERCPCHEHLQKRTVHRKRKADHAFVLNDKKFSFTECPMRGKRAAELAAGAVQDLIASLLDTGFHAVSGRAEGSSLSEADRTIIIRDFSFAKDYLNFGLSAKLQFWQTLPWRLVGLSHHYRSTARSIARACLQQYDEISSAGNIRSEHHHPLTIKFLSTSEESSLRRHVQDFAEGQPMCEALEIAVAGLKFVPVVERVVEGLHRDVKIAAKHQLQLGPTKVSLAVRLREIRTALEKPDFLRQCTETFERVRFLKRAAVELGVVQHPDILDLISSRETDYSVWWSRLQKVVHRCNLREQFADHTEARQQHSQQHEADKKTSMSLHALTAPKPPRTFEGIFKRFICDRLRAIADDASCFLSLPAQQTLQDGQRYEVHPMWTERLTLQAQLGNQGQEDDAAARGWILEAKPDDHEQVQSTRMVFRILHSHPNKLKFVPGPVASKPMFQPAESVVTLHSVLQDSETGPTINISARTAPQCLRSLEACPLHVLRQDLVRWSTSSGLCYTLPCPGFPHAQVSAMVTSLLDAKGIPDEPYLDPSAPREMCLRLQQLGFLQIAPGQPGQMPQVVLARLTSYGMQCLRVVSDLSQPEPVCSQSAAPLSECDTLDLALKLEDAGWTWKALPSKVKDRRALTHRSGSPKIWYSQSHFVSKDYLRCLLDSERIFETSDVTEVPHWVPAPKKVYPALLRGENVVALQALPDQPQELLEPDLPDDEPVAPLAGGIGALTPPSPPSGDDAEVDDMVRQLEELFDEAPSDEDVAADALPADGEEAAADDLGVDDNEGAHPPAPEAPAGDVLEELEKPSAYGPFRLTPKQPDLRHGRRFGGFEASCPFHRKNNSTGCKKYLSLRSNDIAERQSCLRALKYWCLSCLWP